MTASRPSAIFLCGRNSVRSPMAEALWRRHFGQEAVVISCGTDPAGYPDGFMINVMSELDIDMSTFEPRPLEASEDVIADVIICLAPEAESEAKSLAQERSVPYERWQVSDPAMQEGDHGERLEAYRISRDAIAQRISEYARMHER